MFFNIRIETSKIIGKTQKCYTYHFGDFGSIIIEHGANLLVTPNLKHNYCLDHHVNQAENYHNNIHPDETWVIHWTTIKKSTYIFPDSKIVSILHIYHDKIFHKLKIVTNNKVIKIENALPKTKLEKEFIQPEKKKQKLKGK